MYELNLPNIDLSVIHNGYGQIDLFDSLYEIVKGMIVLETLPRWTEWDNDHTHTDTSTEDVNSERSTKASSLLTIGWMQQRRSVHTDPVVEE
jgi:hypothetical protein